MNQSLNEPVAAVTAWVKQLRAEIAGVIVGQEQLVDRLLVGLLANGHVLLEGVPGLAKTLSVRTLASAIQATFRRIQFTPDLLPADIVGNLIYSPQDGKYHATRGPVFTNFLLADEINRAPAKTQSALLQAMQERKVTIDRETHELPATFTVFATQNPVEYEGTYPLPEAQKDRFMLKVAMSAPGRAGELELAQRMLGTHSPEETLAAGEVQAVITAQDLADLRRALETVTVREELVAYVVDVVRATRENDTVLVGAGPRATQALLLASRANAALAGRDFVTPDDVKSLCEAVLGHRLVLRPEYEIEGTTISEVVGKILEQVTVPR